MARKCLWGAFLGVEVKRLRHQWLRVMPCLTFLAGVTGSACAVDFNRDVRPILSENCFQCHGFDAAARKSGLRLDVREGATSPAKSGDIAVTPHAPEKSVALARMTSSDPDNLMPPADTGKKLTTRQIEIIRQWINDGAPYARHWAFEPPRDEPLPAMKLAIWPRNEIDRFVLARLEAENLTPTPEAEKTTLLRRVSLDLTGLPPTLAELDAFLSDTDPRAFEKAVDRLLDSPHYGERMAVEWLDAARYADTNGYFGDKTRQMWLWRDWVIDAYNRDLPYDQFTVEQLAGDLLPNATTSQRIATGFNRNHMANNESGIIDEEYRVEYVVDRLDATATTWMGLTFGCAQCHDHKFDPISQKEFYQAFAFFNNVPETGLIKDDDPPPLIRVPSPTQEDQMKMLAQRRIAAEQAFARVSNGVQTRQAAWEQTAAETLPQPSRDGLVAHYDFEERLDGSGVSARRATPVGTTIQYEYGLSGQAAKFDATQHAEVKDFDVFQTNKPWSISVWLQADTSLGGVLSKIEPQGDRRGVEMIWQKGRLQINLVHRWGVNAIEVATVDQISSKRWHQVVLSYDGISKASGLRVYVDGKNAAVTVHRDLLGGSIRTAEPLRIGRRDDGLGFYGMLDELRVYGRAIHAEEAEDLYWGERLRGILKIAPDKRNAAEKALMQDYYVDHQEDAVTRDAYHAVQLTREAEQRLRETIPTALVMQEMAKPRKATVLMRGIYDQPGEEVQPDVPASIAPWPKDAPHNRLGFARWLTSPSHPLTARVAVNRLWQQCFGEGLVRTANDFGSQGEPPTHPALLDWMARHYVNAGWKTKDMLRLIVTSATYRQSSASTEALTQRDPENRLLARGPRFRLSGEMLRDQALAASGILVPKVGGPSVKPYQPPGLWEAVSYNGEETYVPDQGTGLWRRSLYTFWKRQAPPPALLTFDGPTREKCTIRRARTNTPLQSLVLLNDTTYVEAARVLGALALKHSDDDDARLRLIFRRVLARHAGNDEVSMLQALLMRQRSHFTKHRENAARLIAVGASPAGRNVDPSELAAWTVVAQAVLNLDETITRR